MKYTHKILLLLLLLIHTVMFGQTPGFNYQALLLNSTEIQIPGTDVAENKVPLGLEEVTFRFTITNEAGIEYVEEQTVTTDENGMVSLIVGEGTATTSTFGQILWDGKLKYLNVDINVLSNNEGYIFLDTQKILYIPHPTNGGTSGVQIVNTIGSLTPPYNLGDKIWVKEFGENKNPTFMIWDGTNWVPVTDDFDPTNELGLIVVVDAADRGTQLSTPKIGDQVWNKECNCIEVYNGNIWVSLITLMNLDATNGLFKDGNTIKLGGNLNQPTEINTNSTNTLAIKGLLESTDAQESIVVVEQSTGILRKRAISSMIQQEQIIIVALDGQLRFSTPLPISDAKKIDVYRNGVRIDFTILDSTTIELEAEAICYQDDKIRIVQIN